MSTSLEVHRIDSYAISNTYGTNELHLLPKDPEWVFAYWEVTQHKKDEFLDMLSPDIKEKGCWKLKINNLSNGTFSLHDVDIDTSSWYIHTCNPDSLVSSDLGLYLPNGLFISLLSSNIIYTSRNAPSNVANVYYINIFDKMKEYGKKYLFKGLGYISTSGSEAYFGVSSYNLFNKRKDD
ncbi:MAG TPA: DUF4912 domain-containing protein [Clostridiales bacterium]|nr:DUF4912 domain-containing protein [Clostridiales bacterium]